MAVYFADLVAFVKLPDLPPSLVPFVNQAAVAKQDSNVRVIVFKIRGTVDSYYSIPVKKGATVKAIAERMKKDLKVVKIADESVAELKPLLAKFRTGEFAHLLKHEIDKKYPYRH